MSRAGHLVVLGNPENRRVRDLRHALGRRGWRDAHVVSYEEALDEPVRLEAACDGASLLRIESAGQNPRVETALLRWGAGAELPAGAERIGSAAAAALRPDRGRIRAPAQLAAGFARFLERVAFVLARTGAASLAPPSALVELTDKHRCHRRLAAAGVRQPRRLDPPASWAELRDAMARRGHERVFLKLRHGSSGSGVVALRARGDAVRATTSVEFAGTLDEPVLYNSRRIRSISSEREVAVIADRLCAEGAVAEAWIPKESDADGRCFDLRILCIAGEPAHTVVRTSSGPITNLHLGNRRGCVEGIRARLGEEAWRATRAAAAAVAAAYPDCLQLGVDLLVARGSGTPYVVEVNAFGDLLPGVLWRGVDGYEAQLRALEAGWSAAA